MSCGTVLLFGGDAQAGGGDSTAVFLPSFPLQTSLRFIKAGGRYAFFVSFFFSIRGPKSFA